MAPHVTPIAPPTMTIPLLVVIERHMTAIYRLIITLLAPMLQFTPADRLRGIIHRALPYWGALSSVMPGRVRVMIQVEVRTDFHDDVEDDPENEVDVVELDEIIELPAPAEDEIDMLAIQNLVQDDLVVQAPLLRSLFGILRQDA